MRSNVAFTHKQLVSIDDAADYLGVHDKTIRRWIAGGRITGYRLGTKTLRVDLIEIDALATPITTTGTIDEAS